MRVDRDGVKVWMSKEGSRFMLESGRAESVVMVDIARRQVQVVAHLVSVSAAPKEVMDPFCTLPWGCG